MKKIYNILFGLFSLFVLHSCTEKELILPETTTDDLEVLPTRPPLRPDGVQVYPAFYHTVEIVYPAVQPDRAIKSIITYTGDDNTTKTIEVTDFDQIVKIEGLSLKEYEFKIIYLTADDITSRAVLLKATPYPALTDYVYNTLAGYGEFGVAYIHWENVTDQEVEVVVSYEEGGESKSVSKSSSKLRDTIAVPKMPNIDLVFNVQVEDLVREHNSDVKQLTINPGLSVENYALSTLAITPGFGRAFLTWENPEEADLKLNLSYTVAGETKTTTYESAAVSGTYTLVNLPQGAMNIQAKFTNVATSEASDNRALAVVVDKGVKETVSESVTLGSYPFNFALVNIANPSSIPIEVTVSYEKSTGGSYEETITIASNTSNQPVPLYEVKTNAKITVTVVDDIGDIDREIQSTVSNVVVVPPNTELNRTGWKATASSSRTYQAGLDQLFDGLGGNNGWQSNHGYGSLPADPPDPITGTGSNRFPHYIVVDMLDVKYITGLSFLNHSNGVQNGPGTFIVQYSFDGEVFQDGETMQRPLGNTANGNGANARTHHYLSNPLIARYIRIWIVSGDNGNPSDGVVRIADLYMYGIE